MKPRLPLRLPGGRALAGRAALALALLAPPQALLEPAARAAAPPFPVELSVTETQRDGVAGLSAAVHTLAGRSCVLLLAAGGLTRSLPRRTTGSSGTATWTVPRDGLPTATRWRLTATCRAGELWSRRFTVLEPGLPSAPGALAPPQAVSPLAPGASCDAERVCFTNDPFPVGQCTWYAAGRRPDLDGIVHGDAYLWLEEARGHVPEGWFPVVGAIAVWASGREGADADGHVAYVAAVSAGGEVLLDDSNWRTTPGGPGLELHEHWVSPLSPSGYIYGGPAGSGPR